MICYRMNGDAIHVNHSGVWFVDTTKQINWEYDDYERRKNQEDVTELLTYCT